MARQNYWQDRRESFNDSRRLGEVHLWMHCGRIYVSAPADEDFMLGASQLGGRFRPRSGGVWTFPFYARKGVEALISRTFGRGAILSEMPEIRRTREDE